MLVIFIMYPWLAFAVALAMLALYLWRHSRAALIVSGSWVLYGIYEHLMRARVLCSGECNIRVDLLLLYPALAVATVAAILRSYWRRGGSNGMGRWGGSSQRG
jgi:hypothetical protein